MILCGRDELRPLCVTIMSSRGDTVEKDVQPLLFK